MITGVLLRRVSDGKLLKYPNLQNSDNCNSFIGPCLIKEIDEHRISLLLKTYHDHNSNSSCYIFLCILCISFISNELADDVNESFSTYQTSHL